MAPSTESNFHFHDDLITEILLRLSVKSLLRFRAVCKPWLTLISSHNFIRSHLRRAIASQQSDETLVLNIDWVSITLISLNSCLINVTPKVSLNCCFRDVDATPDVSHRTGDFSITPTLLLVGSCNGIVCASVTNHGGILNYDKLCLWNPATKQYKLIPPPNIHGHRSLGFGFDPIGDDFKIIKVIVIGDREKFFEAEVYSVNRNSWRRVEPSPTNYPYDITFKVCVRGVLCCAGWRGVITFDLHREVFNCDIKYPPTCDFPCVTEYKDLIALMNYSNDNGSSKIKLWTLDDACLHGGIGEPWTLIFSFDVALGSVDMVYGCFNNGDIILRVYDSDKDDYNVDYVHFLCNPENGESKIVHFPESAGRFFRHIESLVPVKGSKQVIYDSNADDNLERQLLSYSGYDE